MISGLIAGGTLVSLVGYSLLWGRFLRQPFAASLISASCSIVCVLFVAALFGVLYPVQIVAFLGGFPALFAWGRRAGSAEITSTLQEPALAIFLVAYVGFFALSRGMLLIYWDEFALWATNSKYLLTTDLLPVVPGAVLYPDYPPGDALFQYFIARLVGFSEGNLIFAHAIFQAATLLPILAATRWRDGLLIASLIVIGWVAGYCFGALNLTNWTSVMVDNEIGYLLAAAFTIYLLGGVGLRAMVCAMPVAVVLPLIKQTGLFFAMVFALLVLVDQITAAAWDGFAKVRVKAGKVVVCLLLFVVPISVNAIWFAHLRATDAALIYTWQKVYHRVAASDFGAKTATIVSTFAETIKGQIAISAGGFTFPAWASSLAVLALIAVAAQNGAAHRMRISMVHVIMAGSLVLYLAFLLLMYVFVLAPVLTPDGQLQSLNRYLGSFLIACVGIGLSSLVHEWRPESRRLFVVPFVALLACAAVYVTRTQAIPSLINHPRADPVSRGLLEMRMNVKERLGTYGKIIPLDSRVYAVWNGTTGLPFYMSAFELKPRPTNARCFSVGKARFDGDIWSCDFSVSKFRELLSSYDFLFVGRADDNFWDGYEELFSPDARRSSFAFFKISKSGEYLLNPVSVAPVSAQN